MEETPTQQLATIVRYCVTKSPGLAAIALWVPYFNSDSTGAVAFTDGRKVVVGRKFWEMFERKEQAFILCHEILHVALRHLPRGQFAYRKSPEHGQLWNVSCDAVINYALGKMSWLQMPAVGVRIEKLLSSEALAKRPASAWSAEAIYEELVGQFREELEGENPNEIPNEVIKEWLDAKGIDDFDMMPAPPQDGDLNDDLASRIWSSRLARAQASDRPGGLLRGLSGDFPVSTTPWPRVLRSFMQDAVLPQSRENWNRPSRRVLAGSSTVFEPATQPEMGIRRAGVVIDTSGSIDDALLMRFCAEISTVQRRTGCEVVLLTADARVQTESRVKNDGRPLIDKVRAGLIEIKGGGGTDFEPAIARLNQLQVSVALYFTDMQGRFGKTPPDMPLLWCSSTAHPRAPFGRVLFLDSLRVS